MKKNIFYTAAVYCAASLVYVLHWLPVPFYKTYAKYRAKRFERDKLKAIKLANELHNATGYRYLVLISRGKLVIKPKAEIKNLLKIKGKYFKPGTTIQDIERIAIYKTA